MADPTPPADADAARLRELEDVAAQLFLSPRTVEYHLRNFARASKTARATRRPRGRSVRRSA